MRFVNIYHEVAPHGVYRYSNCLRGLLEMFKEKISSLSRVMFKR